jgi:hypothetical protein
VVRLASPCVSEAPPPIEFSIDTAGSPPTGPREEKKPR